MLVYIVSALVFVLIIVNFVLSEKLYKIPSNNAYFNNVTALNLSKNKYLSANPRYVTTISILTGIFMGAYLALANKNEVESWVTVSTLLLLCIVYFMEITRRVMLQEGVLTLSRFLYPTKNIDATRVTGIYIYSYNKKFLKTHAYTTKLVVVESDGKKTKFSLSSLNNKAVLSMMKDVFGVNNNKMFIAHMEKSKNNVK